jgi:hypothetical protein
MVLRIYPVVRKMDIELSTLDMGLYKISWDFSGILLKKNKFKFTF